MSKGNFSFIFDARILISRINRTGNTLFWISLKMIKKNNWPQVNKNKQIREDFSSKWCSWINGVHISMANIFLFSLLCPNSLFSPLHVKLMIMCKLSFIDMDVTEVCVLWFTQKFKHCTRFSLQAATCQGYKTNSVPHCSRRIVLLMIPFLIKLWFGWK